MAPQTGCRRNRCTGGSVFRAGKILWNHYEIIDLLYNGSDWKCKRKLADFQEKFLRKGLDRLCVKW